MLPQFQSDARRARLEGVASGIYGDRAGPRGPMGPYRDILVGAGARAARNLHEVVGVG